jgi:hypothetical protein
MPNGGAEKKEANLRVFMVRHDEFQPYSVCYSTNVACVNSTL